MIVKAVAQTALVVFASFMVMMTAAFISGVIVTSLVQDERGKFMNNWRERLERHLGVRHQLPSPGIQQMQTYDLPFPNRPGRFND